MYNQMSDFNGCIITYYCKQYDLNKPMSVPFFFKLLFASTNSSPWFSGCWMLNNQFSFVLKIDYRSAASSYCWWCGTSVIHSLQLDCSTVFASMCYYLQLHTIQVFSSSEQVTLLHATFSYRILLQASCGSEGLFGLNPEKVLASSSVSRTSISSACGLLFTNFSVFII